VTAAVRETSTGREYDADLPPDLVTMLNFTARSVPEKTAFIDDQRSVTWTAFAHEVEVLAGRLGGVGISPGDRVALLFGNGIPYTVALWAVWTVGGIVVPLNTRLQPDEMVPLLRDATPRLLLAGRGRAEAGAHVGAAVGVPVENEANGRLLADAPRAEASPAVAGQAPAAIMYTSGTTGRPKGVVITHANAIQTSGTCTLVVGRRPDDIELIMVPQFNITGLNAQTVPVVHLGMTAVLLDGFDPADVLSLAAQHRVTVTVGASTMWWRIIEAAEGRSQDLASLRLATYGGSPMPTALLDRMRKSLPGAGFGNGYGMTETCSMITYVGGRNAVERSHTVGRPLPITDLRLVDPATGEDTPSGAVGEIAVKGPQLSPGYWSAKGLVPLTDANGWFRTGDAARLEEGFVVLQDRLKDVIKRGGESIYCIEVEELLHQHPAVLEAAVVGVPDPIYGQRVKAHIVLKPGSVATSDDIKTFCRSRAAAFKSPSFVEFQTALPRNPGGKVLKAELRRTPPAVE